LASGKLSGTEFTQANSNPYYPMKLSKLLTLLLAASLPATLALADHDTDNRIEVTAKGSYNFHVVLQDKVKADADNGIVTLKGTVEDKDQKSLAEDTVSGLPGVVRVDNQITVEGGQPEHSDGWIAFKVRGLLLVRANVSATNTHVDVQGGVVTLTGTADTVAQKELTEEYAKEVDGVKSVTDNISVNASPDAKPTVRDEVDDASITTQVKLALLGNRATSAVSTKVKTQGGVVTLAGEADNAAARDLAGRLAQRVRGVVSVTNEMTTKN
jgi:hyperosmotically inducible protein